MVDASFQALLNVLGVAYMMALAYYSAQYMASRRNEKERVRRAVSLYRVLFMCTAATAAYLVHVIQKKRVRTIVTTSAEEASCQLVGPSSLPFVGTFFSRAETTLEHDDHDHVDVVVPHSTPLGFLLRQATIMALVMLAMFRIQRRLKRR